MFRIILINWRWKDFEKDPEWPEYPLYRGFLDTRVHRDGSNTIIVTRIADKNILIDRICSIIDNNPKIQLLVFSHFYDFNDTCEININIEEGNINCRNSINLKRFNFRGSPDELNAVLYYMIIGEKKGHEQINKEKFDYIWNIFWNDSFNKKKWLIKNVLPLAIDIQGLNDCNENQKRRYFEESRIDERIITVFRKYERENICEKFMALFEKVKETEMMGFVNNKLNKKDLMFDEIMKVCVSRDKGVFLPYLFQQAIKDYE